MDLNLILSAQTLQLAPQLNRSEPVNGLLVVKNIPAKTYLCVTSGQWLVLQQFREARTVPAVLDFAIRDRICPPLGEFFELILKALEANILLEPGVETATVHASNWRILARPQFLARPLVVLFSIGLILSLAFRPALPSTVLDVVAGLFVLSAALSAGSLLAGCLVRGGNGEVYRPRWRWAAFPPYLDIDTDDAIMLPHQSQVAIFMARPAMLTCAIGLTVWEFPGWSFLPLIGLIIVLRPILGGRAATLIRVGDERPLSDAEHSYVFTPNRRPRERWRLLTRALQQNNTWARIAYGVIWTLTVVYLGARLTDTPPWTLTFWRTNGVHIAMGVGGSLTALAIGYLGWELFYFARERARARRNTLRRWRSRWFGGDKLQLDEAGRLKAIAESPLLCMLPPPQRQQLSRALKTVRHSPWRSLSKSYGIEPKQVALIVSGKVSLRRQLPSGRSTEVQVLSEGDVIGMHDLADPKHPNYRLRTMTPVTLLTMDRGMAEEAILKRIGRITLTDMIVKLPFLRQISLCQNWHLQAIERFSHLSTLTDYPEGDAIFQQGQYIHDFFIIFEGDALVTRNSKRLATIHAGEFFGEIGLLQNSSSNASIIASRNTRCLSIARREFMRFVTHNHTVAMELERVSSARLGRPIFPLRQGNFSQI
jgi:CRP-like cAMP-binding protein